MQLTDTSKQPVVSDVHASEEVISSLIIPPKLNEIKPYRLGAGGGGGGSARADSNLRNLPCYLSNTCEILSLLLNIFGEQDFAKKFIKGIICGHGNSIFDALFIQILTFL